MATTLYLVRHAQSQPVQGVSEPDWALSERGRAQAAALVPILAQLGTRHVYTSPFRRSRETLQPFADQTGRPLIVYDGLRERCLSQEWIGDFREVWQRSWSDFSYSLPGGESSIVCRDRMVVAVQAIAANHPEDVVALGSHGFSIGLLLTTIDPRFGIDEASAMRTPELVKLTHADGALAWDRGFTAGEAFDAIATHFRHTPGIVA